MPAVHFDQVSFGYTTAADVLRNATLHLGPGWTGVVGANGAGKTTLLRLIAGELKPSEGMLRLDPPDAVVVQVAQEVETRDGPIERFAASWDAPDVRMRGRLGLEPTQLERWSTLSPGERKRWQVGAALARSPDVLLLDEPTNHLDAAGRKWLLTALGRFGGVGLVVSHDRTLLEALTRQTLRVDGGEAKLWGGSYGVARVAWSEMAAAELAEYQGLRRERRKLERRVADQRRTAEAKRAQFKRQQRTSDQKDIDARSAAATKVFRSGEKAAASNLAATVSARDRVTTALEAMSITKELGRDLFIDFEPSPKADLAVIVGDLEVGGRTILAEVSVAVGRRDRVWLRGRNGSGKTTLLEAIRSRAAVPEEKLLYLPQELTAADSQSLLGEVRGLLPDERGRVLALVAALGVDPDVLLATDRPSPGEARKLALATGLGRRAWLLLLDEPTNHMDLPSVERLEAALREYPGAMVIVTHDDAFGRELGLREWHLEDGTVRPG